MKLRIPEKVRIALARKYLDWSESLPEFGGGWIREFQDLRRHQREMSDEDYKRSRPPEGTTVEYLSVRLVEVFHLEDFDKLRDGLMRLLPKLASEISARNFSEEFARRADSISGTSSQMLGYLVRNKGTLLLGFSPYREIHDLPPEVRGIEIELFKILPAVYALSFDVHLTDEATKRLISLQDRRYLPTARFEKLVPWRAWDGGMTENFPQHEMRSAVLGWLEELRGRIEGCIRPYLSGYFTRHFSGRTARLPAIEAFAIKGAPEEAAAFDTWAKDARAWAESLGFRFTYRAYRDERQFFIPSRDEWERERETAAHRLIVLWEPYLKSIDPSRVERDERAAIRNQLRYTMRALLQRIVLVEFLDAVEKNVERLRRVSFGSMTARRRLGTYFKLSNTVQRETMLLNRASLEFEQNKSLVSSHMQELRDLKEVGGGSDKERPGGLAGDSVREIEYRINLLNTQLAHIRNSISEFLELQNMDALYRLQRYVFWLSIIAALAAVVGVAAGWPNIKELWRDLSGALPFKN
jgi:hypothetical protein